MGDQIRLQPGCPPWRPSPTAETVAEYNYYDFPLTGVVRQAGTEYLYQCVRGADEDVNLWVYVRIDHHDRATLEAAPTPEDFDRVLDTLIAHSRPAVVGLAVEGLGLATWAVALWDGEKDLQAAYNEAVRMIERVASHARAAAERP